MKQPVHATQAENGYGLLVCDKTGKRCLDDFDAAQSIQESAREKILAAAERRSADKSVDQGCTAACVLKNN